MITLYTWPTPNGRKVSILLEELGINYRVRPVNINQDEQHAPSFLDINPNGKIPAIVDEERHLRMMETGAIMIYLADKYRRLLAPEGEKRYQAIEWLMWQMSGLGPMLGQAHHFLHFNPGKSAYAEQRYHQEAQRLYGVLETRLAGREYMVDDYSIADIAIWPWIARHEFHQIDLSDYPAVLAWYRRVGRRPAVQRGYNVPHAIGPIPLITPVAPPIQEDLQ